MYHVRGNWILRNHTLQTGLSATGRCAVSLHTVLGAIAHTPVPLSTTKGTDMLPIGASLARLGPENAVRWLSLCARCIQRCLLSA